MENPHQDHQDTNEKSTWLSRIFGAGATALTFMVTKRYIKNEALPQERDLIFKSSKDNVGVKFKERWWNTVTTFNDQVPEHVTPYMQELEALKASPLNKFIERAAELDAPTISIRSAGARQSKKDKLLIKVRDFVTDTPHLLPKTPMIDEHVMLEMAKEGELGLKHMSSKTRARAVVFSSVAAVAVGTAIYQGFKFVTKSRFQPDKKFEESFAKAVEHERELEELNKSDKARA